MNAFLHSFKATENGKRNTSPFRHGNAGVTASRKLGSTILPAFFIFAALGVELFGRLGEYCS